MENANNVLVASTYYESDKPIRTAQERKQQQIPNRVWLNLQQDFIRRNTRYFDFAVYLNAITNKDLFGDCIVIGENDGLIEDPRESHRLGLRHILEHFREHKSEYSAFCILDSDAFPIKFGWLEEILDILKVRGLKFAAIARFENGENFPHPAAMVIPSEYIDEDLFHFPEDFEKGTINTINGDEIYDTGAANSFWKDGKLVGHPLLRSNVINLHPLYAGVYADFFYHHGLGSRIRRFTAQNGAVEPHVSYKMKSYWHLHGNFRKDFWVFFDLIMKQPQKFINILRGENIKHATSKGLLNYFNQPAKIKFDFPPFNP